MIILLIVLASIASYFAVGWLCCRYTLPAAIARGYKYHKDHYSSLGEDSAREWALENGLGWRVGTVLFWWVAVPITFFMSSRLVRTTESYAPWAKQAEMEDRERRIEKREREIAKLERELGIGR